jgi:hypothetical protein
VGLIFPLGIFVNQGYTPACYEICSDNIDDDWGRGFARAR